MSVNQNQLPIDVLNAMAALRADLARIHGIHECDDDCPPNCPSFIGSDFDYSDHDEHNADVREDIEFSADQLLQVLEQWQK